MALKHGETPKDLLTLLLESLRGDRKIELSPAAIAASQGSGISSSNAILENYREQDPEYNPQGFNQADLSQLAAVQRGEPNPIASRPFRPGAQTEADAAQEQAINTPFNGTPNLGMRVGGAAKPTLSGKVAVPDLPESDLSVSLGDKANLKLGGLLKALGSNTGLTALGIGAQGIGGIMQGRAQSKADKGARKQQRTNNAIAAFTGGQAAQAAPRQANSTGGNILSALGQTLGGVANARRADQATEFDQDLETQKLDILQDRNDTQRYVAEQNARARGGSGAGGEGSGVNKGVAALQVYMTALRNAELKGVPFADELADTAGVKRLFPESTAALTMQKAVGVQIATVIQGSRPTDRDALAFQEALPQIGENEETRIAKERNLRLLMQVGDTLAQSGKRLGEGWTSALNDDLSFNKQALGLYVESGGPAESSDPLSNSSPEDFL